jgi:hypothetical protein
MGNTASIDLSYITGNVYNDLKGLKENGIDIMYENDIVAPKVCELRHYVDTNGEKFGELVFIRFEEDDIFHHNLMKNDSNHINNIANNGITRFNYSVDFDRKLYYGYTNKGTMVIRMIRAIIDYPEATRPARKLISELKLPINVKELILKYYKKDTLPIITYI